MFSRFRQLLQKPGVPDGELERKQLVVLGAFVLPFVFAAVMWTNNHIVTKFCMGAVLLSFLVVVGWVFCTKRCSNSTYSCLLFTMAIGTCIMDLSSLLSFSQRKYPFLILMVDAAYIGNVSARTLLVANSICVLWITLTCPLAYSQEVREVFQDGCQAISTDDWLQEQVDLSCGCSRPPCHEGLGYTFVSVVQPVILLVIHTMFTRQYSRLLRRDKQQMAASIETAQMIAMHLAVFDLDGAETLLQLSADCDSRSSWPSVADAGVGEEGSAAHGEGGTATCGTATCPLPHGLRAAFIDILSNLKLYRPYLPRSCLPLETTSPQHSSVPDDSRSTARRHESVSSTIEVKDCVAEDTGTATCTTAPSNSISLVVDPLDESVMKSQSSNFSRLESGNTEEHHLPVSPLTPLTPVCVRPGQALSTTLTDGQPAHGPAPRILLAPPKKKLTRYARVTVAHINMHNTIALCSRSSEFVPSLARVLTEAMSCFHRYKGMVDLFMCDRVFVSFNASKSCVRHATSAAAASREFLDIFSKDPGARISLNVALVTGAALCGDMGCDVMKRYNVAGDLSFVGLERVGRALGIGIICNNQCQLDSCSEHDVRLFPREVEFRRNRWACPLESWRSPIWEVATSVGRSLSVAVSPKILSAHAARKALEAAVLGSACHQSGGDDASREGVIDNVSSSGSSSAAAEGSDAGEVPPASPRGSVANTEWMYNMEDEAVQHWNQYNDSVRRFLKGASVEAAVATMPRSAVVQRGALAAVLKCCGSTEPYVQYL